MDSFLLQTDHKPLVPLINEYNLDKAPLWCQRLLMRLMRFNVTAIHVPGKQLIVADRLSRSPLSHGAEPDMEQDVEAYVRAVVTNKPISSERLDEIRETTKNDSDLQTVIKSIRSSWLHRTAAFQSSHAFYTVRNHLSEADGLGLNSYSSTAESQGAETNPRWPPGVNKVPRES